MGKDRHFFRNNPNIEHDDYMKLPIEVRKEGKSWKLKKVVYGLNDAARDWLHSVRRLIELGCLQNMTMLCFTGTTMIS